MLKLLQYFNFIIICSHANKAYVVVVINDKLCYLKDQTVHDVYSLCTLPSRAVATAHVSSTLSFSRADDRPLRSSKNPYFQNETKCTTFLVEMSFICKRMKNHFHTAKAEYLTSF